MTKKGQIIELRAKASNSLALKLIGGRDSLGTLTYINTLLLHFFLSQVRQTSLSMAGALAPVATQVGLQLLLQPYSNTIGNAAW